MPIIGDDAPQQGSQAVTTQMVKIPNTTMQYSMTSLQDLAANASDYTLALISSDASPSVEPFVREMEEALKTSVEMCLMSPRANNLLLRHTLFHAKVKENHGWKLLANINLTDYDGCIKLGSSTAVFDAAHEGLSVMKDNAERLVASKFGVNGIAIFITDGEDFSSHYGASDVRKVIESIRQEEKLESLVTILIGVGCGDASGPSGGREQALHAYLTKFKDEAGLTHFVPMKALTKSSAAKLAGFISKSISSTAMAKGTGGPSQALSQSQNLTI